MGVGRTSPLILAQLNYLITHSPYSIKVEQAWSGSKNPAFLDRFSLSIPFCLDYIQWDVIYNAHFPLVAPDVVFGPEDEHFRPYNTAGEGDSKSVRNSLFDWNSKDPTRLLALILELRGLYMAYQKKRVGEVDDERLKFEIRTMHSREGIEMHVSSDVNKQKEVKFAVPLLEMDINKMITGPTWRPQKIYLQAIFPIGIKCQTAASAPHLKLVSSPELKALFSIEDFRLPLWVNGMCMAEYLLNLEDMLGSHSRSFCLYPLLQVRDAILSIEVRRKFIMALATSFGRPVEADPIFCRKATFLAASGFTFLVHFSLSLEFPKQPPELVLQSSQHFDSQGAPIKSRPLQDFPWIPKWEASDMAQQLFDYLVEECLKFKKHHTDKVVEMSAYKVVKR